MRGNGAPETDNKQVEVVARGVVWAVALGDDGVTHSVHIDQNYDEGRVIWGCRGMSQPLYWIVRRSRLCDAGTPVTCLDCIARGLP